MQSTHDGRTAVLIAVSELLIFAFTLISVRKESLGGRLASCTLLVSLTFTFLAVAERAHDIKALLSILPPATWTVTFHAVDILLVCRASIDDFVNTKQANGARKPNGPRGIRRSKWTVKNLLAALSLLCNWRRIGTPWQISKIPPFSQDRSVPSRGRLILKRLLFVVASFAVLDIYSGLRPDPSTFEVGKVALFSRLGDISAAEATFRLVHTAGFFLSAVVGVYLLYAMITVVVLCTGLSTPASCPPMFGSLSDAYTIRGFWGDFYHQGLRRAITGPSDAFVDNVICIPRGNLVSRYLRLLLAFMSSGFMHHFGDLALGIPAVEAGQFIFFTMQAFGIMLEDGIVALYKTTGRPLPRALERMFGYLWVFAWLVWTGPGWYNPFVRYMGPQPSVFKDLVLQG